MSICYLGPFTEREYVALGKCKLVGLRVNVGLSHVAHADIHMAEVQVSETPRIVGSLTRNVPRKLGKIQDATQILPIKRP